ncbi:MAG TPA: hypothetical protein VF815_12655 [Myxococcaceae bacterium]|jgi:hypothetical protein
MLAQKNAKKLSVKKETLRTLDDTQVQQLDAANGGATPVVTITIISITITLTDGC